MGTRMKLLVDTHVLFWWLSDRTKLSPVALLTIADRSNEVYVSVASAWELAIKVGLNKWPDAKHVIENFDAELAAENFLLLPITVTHARAAGFLQTTHKDPFDRLLVAQALAKGLILITSDAKLVGIGAPVIW
jgi:PIN domain nuclease of toxin-antitoxin system